MSEPKVIITKADGSPFRKWRCRENVEGVSLPHVGAGSESEHMVFLVWNNKKTKEFVSMELITDSGAPNFTPDADRLVNGTINITLGGVSYPVSINTTGNGDTITDAIVTSFNLLGAPWVATKVINDPVNNTSQEVFRGKVIQRPIIQFESNNYEDMGEASYSQGTTDLNCAIERTIIGNAGDEDFSNITEVELYCKDKNGGYSSDVVTGKWTYAKINSVETYTNLGADIVGEVVTDRKLLLKGNDASIPVGEISGLINGGNPSINNTNYCRVESYLKLPNVMTRGLREFSLMVYYNFI